MFASHTRFQVSPFLSPDSDAGSGPSLSNTVEVLEQLARDTQQAHTILQADIPGGSLDYYQKIFRIDFNEVLQLVRSNIPLDQYLIADIGGSTGLAIGSLTENNPDFKAFCIDPEPLLLVSSEGMRVPLPLERFIVASAEDLSGIRNDTFHVVISCNALTYTDVSKSIPELYRILAPGGVAVLDIEDWSTVHRASLTSLSSEVLDHTLVRSSVRGTITPIREAFVALAGDLQDKERREWEHLSHLLMTK